jgi:predicted nucleotidyltransferase
MTDSLPNNNLIENIRCRICRRISDSETAIASIDTVYIFGSVLDKKRFKKKSDIDIAFLVNKPLYKKDPLNASRDPYLISTEIGLSLERQTDVIILNSASIETIFQIISTGIVIYEKNTEKRIEYEIAAKGIYFDFKPFLDTLRSKTLSG